MLFCLQLTAGTQAPPWKGSLPPYGRVTESSFLFSISVFLSVPDLLSAAVFPPACDPSVASRVLVFSEPGRAPHGDGLCSTSPGWPLCPGGLLWVPGQAAELPLCCRHTYQSDSSLVISHVRPEDAGTYTCLTSDGRTESRQIQLQITGELSSTQGSS